MSEKPGDSIDVMDERLKPARTIASMVGIAVAMP
jgi:hypothetical protein